MPAPLLLLLVIRSFAHKGLRRFYDTGDTSRVKQDHVRRLQLLLTALDAACTPEAMHTPGSGFHALKGELKGFWSVRVSGNWRLVFRFEEGDAYDVDYLDYH